MASENADLTQQILQATLHEVSLSRKDSTGSEDPCVICLDGLAARAVALPCGHDTFDFLCLVTWLEQQPFCPLCKTTITQVKHDIASDSDFKLYDVPPPQPPSQTGTSSLPSRTSRLHHQRRFQQDHNRGPRRPRAAELPPPTEDAALQRRRNIYRNNLYSLHIGSNRHTRIRTVTPQTFATDDDLLPRARKWIRRELQVFEFLQSENGGADATAATPNRRANNAEFLLEYIIAILRTVDLKDSSGHAEDLLSDFLGRENTRLFLHELLAWLQSPYIAIENWDRNVQYPAVQERRRQDSAQCAENPRSSRSAETGSQEQRGGLGARWRGRSERKNDRRGRGDSYHPYYRDESVQTRRLNSARQRYRPD